MSGEKRSIPKKFSRVKSSFVNRLYDGERRGSFSRFSVFPKKLHFYSKDPGEEVVLLVRVHPIAYIPGILLVLLFLLLPFLFMIISSTFDTSISPTLFLGLFVVGVGVALNIFVTTILRWYYSVVIITDRRIVVVKLQSAFYHSYSEAQLEKIEDVTHSTAGLIGNVFDVGNLDIDTAGHEIDFRLKLIPRPRELHDVLNDLVDMKKKGEI